MYILLEKVLCHDLDHILVKNIKGILMNISSSNNRERVLSENTMEINDVNCFSKEMKDSFKIMLKHGIYKELHNKKLLTDEQLNSLLAK